jgi:hypothetical protein
VCRVETDCQRNQRYPRNCTIHYGCHGQLNSAGKLDMKSFRIPFPPKRFEVAQRISQLMERIPKKILEREAPPVKGKARTKVRLIRIGVCATEMDEEVNKHGSIANYFSVAATKGSPTGQNKKIVSQAHHQSTPKKVAAVTVKDKAPGDYMCTSVAAKEDRGVALHTRPNHENSSVEYVEEKPTLREDSSAASYAGVEDKDLQMARELQASFDREKNALDRLDKISSSQPPKREIVAPQGCRGGSQVSAPEDKDMELARKLQASYDREHQILARWESNKRRGSLSNRGKQGDNKKAKTKKISSFFEPSK